MIITITDPFGNVTTFEQLMAHFARCFKLELDSLLSAKNRLYEATYDSEYNEFGNPREYTYPTDLAEAKKKYAEELESFAEYMPDLLEASTYPSLDVAESLSDMLMHREPSKVFSVRTEKRGGLEFLLVCDGEGNEFTVDIDTEISAESRRCTFEDEKVIDGVAYPLYSFIPERYIRSYEHYKKNVRGKLI